MAYLSGKAKATVSFGVPHFTLNMSFNILKKFFKMI